MGKVLLLILILSATFGGHPSYTFDPFAISSVSYSKRNCRWLNNDWIHCRSALFTFNKIILGKTLDQILLERHSNENQSSEQKQPAGIIIRYKPKKCKPIHDKQEHYECKDVSINKGSN